MGKVWTVRKRRRKKLPVPKWQLLLRPVHPDAVWSMDFMFDELANVRRVMRLMVVDDCRNEAVQIAVDTSIPALYVKRVLAQIKAELGLPKTIRTGTGPGVRGPDDADMSCQEQRGAADQPAGKPVQAAYIESFNRRFRDECLPQHRVASPSHMSSVIDHWREDHNQYWPHSNFGYAPPAVFAAPCRKHAGGKAPNPASTAAMQTPGL